MPSHTYKSAAVPFVNQKGERSMKRVKVERYVAGKKPSYGKDDDEEEYYTTDNEEDDSYDDEEEEGDEEEYEEREETSKAGTSRMNIYENVDDDNEDDTGTSNQNELSLREEGDDVEEEEDDDDPRFRRLKQLDSKRDAGNLLDVQTSSRAITKHIDDKIIMDDEEEDEDIRERHALARAKLIEEPIGPQAILGDISDQQSEVKQAGEKQKSLKEETEDILKDLKLDGFKPKSKKDKTDAKLDEQLKDMIEQAKQEAIFTAQLHKKIQEDNKIELEKEALRKGDIGAYDMDSVKTDDEDDEIAYEEWKLREIKRVLRDRSERVLEAKAKC